MMFCMIFLAFLFLFNKKNKNKSIEWWVICVPRPKIKINFFALLANPTAGACREQRKNWSLPRAEIWVFVQVELRTKPYLVVVRAEGKWLLSGVVISEPVVMLGRMSSHCDQRACFFAPDSFALVKFQAVVRAIVVRVRKKWVKFQVEFHLRLVVRGTIKVAKDEMGRPRNRDVRSILSTKWPSSRKLFEPAFCFG